MLPSDDPLAYRCGPFSPVRATAALVGMGVPPMIAKTFALLLTAKEGLIVSATNPATAPETAGDAADVALKLAAELCYHGADILRRLEPLLEGDSKIRARLAIHAAYESGGDIEGLKIIVPGQG